MRHPHSLHDGKMDWAKIRLAAFSQDDSFRFLLRTTFRKLNIKDVRSTASPFETEQQMAADPDLLLVDFAGEASAALDFLRRVRERDADVSVLVVVRSDQKDTLAEACRHGVEGTVPRPVSAHELIARVSATLLAPSRLPVPDAPAKPRPVIPVIPPSAIIREEPKPAAAPTPPPALPPAPVLPSKPPVFVPRPQAQAGGAMSAPQPKARDGEKGIETAAPPPVKVSNRLEEADLAPPPPAADEAARRKKAERDKALWQESLAKSGHKAKAGKDVAALDVSAIVVQHTDWLASKGGSGQRANFEGMDLGGIDLSRTVLANAGFRRADLSDSLLAESRLDGADLRHATMGAADMAGANLGVAQMRHADLRLANLEGAILRGADLSGARLGGARLAGADFKGAVLLGADLAGADLSQVENMTQAQVDKAIFDMKTKLPPGLWRPSKDDDADLG